MPFKKRPFKRCGIVLAVLSFFAFCACTAPVDTEEEFLLDKENYELYKNPLNMPNAWKEGVADPFIMKYNGTYYLYCTTNWQEVGLKVWSSENLVNWKYEGLASSDLNWNSTWGQEIFYYDGLFYTTFSQAGGVPEYNGIPNALYTAKSPLGPFRYAGYSYGRDDVSIFVDDDAWYLTKAGGEGVMIHELLPGGQPKYYTQSGSVKVLDESKGNLLQTNWMQNWTEGPHIMKRNGLYYMLYTGNHWQSAGYRMDLAVGESPAGPYQTLDTPFLISTEDNFRGLGHGHWVEGLDLDSWFVVYHNLTYEPIFDVNGDADFNAQRQACVNRVEFNGKNASIQPTNSWNVAPKAPDMSVKSLSDSVRENWDANGDTFLSKLAAKNGYSAEFNFENPSSPVDVIVGAKDCKNYDAIRLDGDTDEIFHVKIKDGKQSAREALAKPTDGFTPKNHTKIGVQKDGGTVKVTLNNMRVLSEEIDPSYRRIGYVCGDKACVKYTAMTLDVNGSSDYDSVKPVPGRIEAPNFLKGFHRGWRSEATAVAGNVERADEGIAVVAGARQRNAIALGAGEWVSYGVNVRNDDTYAIDAMLKSSSSACKLNLYVDNVPVRQTEIKGLTGAEWQKNTIAEIELTRGLHILTIESKEGVFTATDYELYRTQDSVDVSNTLTSDISCARQIGSSGWAVTQSGALVPESGNRRINLLLFGSHKNTNYRLSVDVSCDFTRYQDAGILVRTVNPSYHLHQVLYGFTGYYVRILPGKIQLTKVSYSQPTVLEEAALGGETKFTLSVEACGNRIRAYVNGGDAPAIEYADDMAFTHGYAGLINVQSSILFQNLKITSVS